MKLPRRHKIDATVPALAMGDIAFLLLIFFVILARAQDESHLRWQPATAPEVVATQNAIASVVIDADHRTHLNGRETTIDQLDEKLRTLLGDAEPGSRTVLLKVHRTTQAKYFEPVVEAVSMAGGDLIHVLEPEEKK